MFPNIIEDQIPDSDEDDPEIQAKKKEMEKLNEAVFAFQQSEQAKKEDNSITFGQKGDILSKYKIPVNKKGIDPTLELPDDSDSSKFSSDVEQEEQMQSNTP